MNRRQIISALLAILLIGLNIGAWFWLRGPSKKLPDSRANIAKQRMKSWSRMDKATLDTVEATLNEKYGDIDGGGNEYRTVTTTSEQDGLTQVIVVSSLINLDSPEDKLDLYRAIDGAVSAISKSRSIPLFNYMKERGLELDSNRFTSELLKLVEANIDLNSQKPYKQFEAVWQAMEVDAHWDSWIPDTMKVRIRDLKRMHQISMVQLGETESWLWNNQSLHKTFFRGDQSIEMSVYKKQNVKVADVSFVIVLDEQYNKSLCPCYLRFWKSDEQKKWLPYALKVVYTDLEDKNPKPALLF